MSKRIAVLAYGVICYLCFAVTILYAIGFVGNLVVPKSMDSNPVGGLVESLAIDAALLTIFALQHSVMARAWFKKAWTKIIPQAVERSTFVLFTCAALGLMFWQWRPLGGEIWRVDHPAGQAILYTMFAAGWALVVVCTFLINHFDLFGLRQVWLHFQGRPYTHPAFRTPVIYRSVRHPLYLGFLIAFWSTPEMTATHLFFAVMTTGYILTAIQFEERDLVRVHGDAYRKYKESVPMILPVGGTRTDPADGAYDRATA